MVQVVTPPCMSCGLVDVFDLEEEKVRTWRAGRHVQDVWPEMEPPVREQLISGTHPKCWDEMFGSIEEAARFDSIEGVVPPGGQR